MEEVVAAEMHAVWTHWMKYLQANVVWQEGVGWIIPEHFILRWQRQMRTPYAELPEEEKQSDRHQAQKVLAVIERVM